MSSWVGRAYSQALESGIGQAHAQPQCPAVLRNGAHSCCIGEAAELVVHRTIYACGLGGALVAPFSPPWTSWWAIGEIEDS